MGVHDLDTTLKASNGIVHSKKNNGQGNKTNKETALILLQNLHSHLVSEYTLIGEPQKLSSDRESPKKVMLSQNFITGGQKRKMTFLSNCVEPAPPTRPLLDK